MSEKISDVVEAVQRLLDWGNRDAARRRLSAALQEQPRAPQLWYWMARALDDKVHAIEALERALKFDPAYGEAQALLDQLRDGTPRQMERFDAPATPPPATPPPATPPATPPPAAPAEPQRYDWSFLEEGAAPDPTSSSSSSDAPFDWALDGERAQTLMSPASDAATAWPLDESADDEGTGAWSILDELQVQGSFRPTESQPSAASSPATPPNPDPPLEDWSLLAELESDPAPIAAAEPLKPAPAADAGDTWALLDELGMAPPASPAPPAPAADATLSEEALWARAAQVLAGEPAGGRGASLFEPSSSPSPFQESPSFGTAPPEPVAVPEPAAVAEPVLAVPAGPPPPGSLRFADAPPIATDGLPTRNSLPPLSAEQMLAALAPAPAERSPEAAEEKRGRKADKEAKPPKEKGPPSRAAVLLRRLVLPLLMLALLLAGAWWGLQNVPDSTLAGQPALATLVTNARALTAPRPTPLPAPDWVAAARGARFANDFAGAEQQLRDGLAAEPTNLPALVALSELRGDLPGGEGEALTLAQQAFEAAQSPEERALAAEALAWAMLRQPSPDVGAVQVAGEQAAALTPRSPHAQWARAIAHALYGETSQAGEAAALAARLAGGQQGESAAWQGRIAALTGEPERAVALYQQALDQSDYAPWHAALAQLLIELERPDEAQPHLARLQALLPEHPLLQSAPPPPPAPESSAPPG